MIREFIDLYNYHKKHCVENATSKIEYFRRFKSRCLKLLNKPMTKLKVLDVGCGKTYPFSYLFHLEGSQVTSLDTQYITTGINKYVKMLYHDEIKVSLKSLVRDILFTPTERKILKAGAEASNKTSNITFICSSAKEIPFPNNSFDVVFSVCAFEHIPNVEKAISECARVVTPEGLIYISYHLFTSISGGHHTRWFYPDSDPPSDIPPWFHLRGQWDKYMHGMDYNLNFYTLEDYRIAFGRHVLVLKEFSDKREGQKFLTEDVRRELAQYSEEELLTAFKTVIARKKS